MLKEELTKTADVLPCDLFTAATLLEENDLLAAYRLNTLAIIIAQRDDLREEITKEMRHKLLIAFRGAVEELEQDESR